MGRGNKLERFAQIKTFPNVFEPDKKILYERYPLSGKWKQEVFKNNNPITLELGCGKGEYSVGLAEKYPGKNFIGIDIKGARMWKGAKYALENKLSNVAFIRSRIEFIENLFEAEEVDEIWITFPDPYPKKPSNRLSSSFFLNRYKKILVPEGIIHLKTDSRQLHDYTMAVLQRNEIIPVTSTNDLYSSGGENDEILGLKTYYEQLFLKENKPITYLKFRIDGIDNLLETDKPWE